MSKANEWRDQPLSQDEVENEREQRPDRGGVGKQVGEKKKTRRGLSTWADNQSVPLTSFTFNNNIHEKIRRIIVWLTYKTCAKIVKQFRKYMWSKCDLRTDEAQGNGAKVRRRNRKGMEGAAPSQFSVLSNCFLRCPMKMWRENFEPINKCTHARPKQSGNNLQISIKTLDLTYFLKIPHRLICRALVHKLAIGQQR